MTQIAYLIIIFLLISLSLYALYIARRAVKQTVEVKHKLTEKIDALEHDLLAVMDGAFGMGDHLEEVKKDLKDTIDKQMQLEQNDLGNMPYNQAVRMVGQGATVDDLVGGCGLSRSEAELVELLHKKSPPVITPEMTPSELPMAAENTGTPAREHINPSSKKAPQNLDSESLATAANQEDEMAFEQILQKFDIDPLATDSSKLEPDQHHDAFSSVEKAHSRNE